MTRRITKPKVKKRVARRKINLELSLCSSRCLDDLCCFASSATPHVGRTGPTVVDHSVCYPRLVLVRHGGARRHGEETWRNTVPGGMPIWWVLTKGDRSTPLCRMRLADWSQIAVWLDAFRSHWLGSKCARYDEVVADCLHTT